MSKKVAATRSGRKARPRRATWKDVELFVGLDLAKTSWKVTVRTKELRLRSLGVPANAEDLAGFLTREYRGARIQLAYEAGCFGYWVRDVLEARGIRVVIVAPHQLPRDLVKTDRLDSAKLARLLAGGLLRSIWVPGPQERMDRSIVRRREQLLRLRLRTQDQIKKLLLFYGRLELLPRPGPWTLSYVRALEAAEFPDEVLTASFRAMLGDYLELRRRIREQERLIASLARTPRYRRKVELLRTLPSVGVLTAMIFLAEIQDVRRFRRADQLASYLGLSPQEYSTGEQQRRGHITRAGSGTVRRILVQLAWRAVRRDPALFEKYQRVRQRRGSKIAIIAVTRQLALRMRRVLLHEKPYVLGVVG